MTTLFAPPEYQQQRARGRTLFAPVPAQRLDTYNTPAANETMHLRLQAAGIDTEAQKPSLLRRMLTPVAGVLDVIARPGYATMNLIRELVNPQAIGGEGYDLLEAVVSGITGKERGIGSDLLEDLGVENKFARGILGFGVDVLTDPLTYLTFGAGNIARQALARNIGEELLKETGQALSEKTLLRLADETLQRKARGQALEGVGKGVKGADAPIGRWSYAVERAYERTKPARYLQFGTAIPFTKSRAAVRVPLGGVGQAAEQTLGQVGQHIGKTRVGELATGLGDVARQARAVVGRALIPGYGTRKIINDIGTRWKDAMRRANRDIIRETTQLTRALKHDIEAMGLDYEKTSWILAKSIDSLERWGTLSPELRALAKPIRDFFKGIEETERRYGVLGESLEFYFPHILKGASPEDISGAFSRYRRRAAKLSTTTSFSKHRALRTLDNLEHFVEWAKKENPRKLRNLDIERDVAKVMAIRKLVSERAIRNSEMILELVNLSGDLIRPKKGFSVLSAVEKGIEEAATRVPPGFVEAPIPQLSKYWVAPELARWLNEFKEPFTNISSIQDVITIYDKALNIWKGLATAPRPGFHLRNGFSNLFNNYIANVRDPADYKLAAAIQAMLQGKGANGFVTIRGRRISYAGLAEMAKRRGVVGQGFFGADIPQTISDAVMRGRGGIHPVVMGREFGTMIEENARLAHFISKLKAGMNADDAAMSVKKFLFDYDELTQFERYVLKRALPFYTWMRKNTPLQFEQLIHQPGIYAKVIHAKNAIEALSPELATEELPEWMKDNFVVRMPFSIPVFQPEGEILYANFDLPYQSLHVPDEVELWGMLSPFLKAPVELLTNYNVFLKREIEKYPGELTQAPGYIWAIAEGVRMGTKSKEWETILRNFGVVRAPNEDGQMDWMIPQRNCYLLDQIVFTTDLGKAISTMAGRLPPTKIASPFLGVGLYSVNPETVARYAAYAENERLRNLYRQAQDLGITIPAIGGTRQSSRQRRQMGLRP